MPHNVLRYCTSLVFISIFGTVQAQDSIVPKAQKPTGYIASYWKNGITLATSPLRWKGEDWAKFGGTIAITGALISMDEAVTQPFFNWQVPFGDAVGNAAYYFGSGAAQMSISGAAIGVGAISHNKQLTNFGLDNLQAQIFTAGITVILKELTHRERPVEGNGAYKWYGPFNGFGNESFFSGHTSLTFCTATMAYLYSHKKWWVGVIGYTLASGVAAGRMQKEAHWASDVVVGGIVGTAVANFVYRQQQKRRENNEKLKVIP